MRKYAVVGIPGSGKGTQSVCGDQLVTREDDTPEALTARISGYHKDINPVLELLGHKPHVFVIDASRDPDTVQTDIRSRLGLPSPHLLGGRSTGTPEEAC